MPEPDPFPVLADIRFCDESVHRCRGRIVNGESVGWVDEDDCRRHIEYLHSKGHVGMAIVRFVKGPNIG